MNDGLDGALGERRLYVPAEEPLGPFVALGVAEDEAHSYARHVDEGRTVVLVQAFERADQARDILDRHGARPGPANAAGPVSPVVVSGASVC